MTPTADSVGLFLVAGSPDLTPDLMSKIQNGFGGRARIAASLEAVIGRDGPIVVITRTPEQALASYLHTASNARDALMRWRRSAEQLIEHHRKSPRKIVLVDVELLQRGNANDIDNLTKKLGVSCALDRDSLTVNRPSDVLQITAAAIIAINQQAATLVKEINAALFRSGEIPEMIDLAERARSEVRRSSMQLELQRDTMAFQIREIERLAGGFAEEERKSNDIAVLEFLECSVRPFARQIETLEEELKARISRSALDVNGSVSGQSRMLKLDKGLSEQGAMLGEREKSLAAAQAKRIAVLEEQLAQKTKLATRYDWGQKIEFGERGDCEAFLVAGWAPPSGEFRWTLGNRPSFQITADAGGTPKTLSMSGTGLGVSPFGMPLEVFVNSVRVWRGVHKTGELQMAIPADAFAEGVATNVIELALPNASWSGDDKRLLGLRLQSASISEGASPELQEKIAKDVIMYNFGDVITLQNCAGYDYLVDGWSPPLAAGASPLSQKSTLKFSSSPPTGPMMLHLELLGSAELTVEVNETFVWKDNISSASVVQIGPINADVWNEKTNIIYFSAAGKDDRKAIKRFWDGKQYIQRVVIKSFSVRPAT